MPSRRAYLASFAAAGLAGCVADSPGGGTESPADTDRSTAQDTPSRPAISVEAAAVQYAYRHIWQVDWNDIRTADGQFVFVTIDATDADGTYSRDAFRLVADGEQHTHVSFENWPPHDPDVPGDEYSPGAEHDSPLNGWLCFETPATLEAPPRLRLDGDEGAWEWSLDVPKATQSPPAWEFTVDAPDTVAPDETFDITITAENVGDGPGTFRGAVNFSYPLHQPKGFDIPLDPGASGTAAVEAKARDADSGQKLRYGIRTPVRDTEVFVHVEGGTATDTG